MPSSYTHLTYHVIFATRDLRPVLGSAWRDELYRYIGRIVLRQGGLLHEIRASSDQVRLLARLRAEPSVAAMLRLVKANSSKWINRRRFVAEGFAWAPGYDAYTVSASRLEAVRSSVRNQDVHPRGSGFERQRRALMGNDPPAVLPDSHTRLLYHVVFSTKYRQPLIGDAWQRQLYALIAALVEAHNGTVIEINGMSDHVHLLARFRAEPSVAVMLRHVKADSSRWVKAQGFLRERFEWQVGYGAFSVSRSQTERVRRYIQDQQEHHRRYSFDDEMKAFLRHHDSTAASSPAGATLPSQG